MRKAQKQQAEEFLQVLGQAQEEMIKKIEQRNNEVAMKLLAQCQESSFCLERFIKEVEREDVSTVSILEKYCQYIYQVYEALSIGQEINISEMKEEFQLLLSHIKDSIEKDITIRKEVVFLPYKASMWDSLESVWKAADEDPDCDAYVVPIPYFDKYPGGGFKDFHYEGNEYPEYVSVTDYHTYDFATRKPDMVFIHNPYDDCNYVTSIHPKFYAENLKKYTDKLVYIPYFVLGEPNLEKPFSEMEEEKKEKLQGFCIQPGVLNSDVVIVQSEAMKQQYVYILTDYFGEHTRPIWEKKILGLGSPKMDKVLGVLAEDIKIPEEWKHVLYNAEGNQRKTILYNTSVSALLKYEECMLDKMKDVLRIFEKNKREVALLWRPHPLMKSTIESMRPQLWEDYEKLVKEYREAGWGIYDDTTDLNRALELADVYYGDGSSLVQLCQEKGIPVMMQNVWVREE